MEAIDGTKLKLKNKTSANTKERLFKNFMQAAGDPEHETPARHNAVQVKERQSESVLGAKDSC